jgi:hypothetical protein
LMKLLLMTKVKVIARYNTGAKHTRDISLGLEDTHRT